jgi:hypothetical protein
MFFVERKDYFASHDRDPFCERSRAMSARFTLETPLLFAVDRPAVSDNNASSCARQIERAGEGPTNYVGVLVVPSFECAGDDATYDVNSWRSSARERG